MRELSDFMIFCLTLALLFCVFGCSDVQRVCPTGAESDVMTIAVDYWTSQGEAVMIADDSECTIRTRIAEAPIPGEQWGKELAVHHVYDIGVTDLAPSHLIQTEIRFQQSMWDAMSCYQRLYSAIHELGHTWYRAPEHYTWQPMQADLPERDSDLLDWFKSVGIVPVCEL